MASRRLPPSTKHANSSGVKNTKGTASGKTAASGGKSALSGGVFLPSGGKTSAKPSTRSPRTVRPFPLPDQASLCAEQQAVIDLPAFRDYLICGQEGNGKTVSALYRAQKISEKCRDRIWLLVPDQKDMQALRASVRGNRDFDGVIIDTYASWLKEFYRAILKKKMPKTDTYGTERSDTDWGQVVRDSYAGVDAYKHIIIDDAHDFPKGLVKAIGMAACYVTCFIDPDKRGETTVTEALSGLLIEAPRTLRGDFRNSPYGVASDPDGGAGTIPGDSDVIELLEGTLSRGLSLKTNRKLYLLVADLLSKLYIRESAYENAINYLMDIDDSTDDVPDSIHLSYLYAQIMTDNIYRFAAEPVLLFQRLDRISAVSFAERAELYRTFLKRLSDLSRKNPDLDLNLEKFRKNSEKYTGLVLSSKEPQKTADSTGRKDPDGFVFDETDGPKLAKILSENPCSPEDKKRLKGLISDYYYDEPLKKNIYRAIIEDDLAKDISGKKVIDAVQLMRYVMKLTGNRGIDRALSEKAILAWCEALSVKTEF